MSDNKREVWIMEDAATGLPLMLLDEGTMVTRADRRKVRYIPEPATPAAGEGWVSVEEAAAMVSAAWDDGYGERDPTGPNPFKQGSSRLIVERAIALSKQRGTWHELLPAPPSKVQP